MACRTVKGENGSLAVFSANRHISYSLGLLIKCCRTAKIEVQAVLLKKRGVTEKFTEKNTLQCVKSGGDPFAAGRQSLGVLRIRLPDLAGDSYFY
jgi:hypothetical protein